MQTRIKSLKESLQNLLDEILEEKTKADKGDSIQVLLVEGLCGPYRDPEPARQRRVERSQAFANNNDQNKVPIATESGIGTILGAMQHHKTHSGVQESGCAALRNLADHSDDKLESIVTENGIDTILAAMKHRETNTAVQNRVVIGCRILRERVELIQF